MENITSNMSFLTFAIGSLGSVAPALQAHDFPLAAGLLVFGLVMVFLYEKTPPTTPSTTT